MEQVEKGLFWGIGIFFFVAAIFVNRMYFCEVNGVMGIMERERMNSYVLEENRK